MYVAFRLYTNTQKAQLKQEENKMVFSFAAHAEDICAAGRRAEGQERGTVCMGLTQMGDALLLPETLVTSVRTQNLSGS